LTRENVLLMLQPLEEKGWSPIISERNASPRCAARKPL
jgi:hypothetical protein